MTRLRILTYNVRGLKDDVPTLRRIISQVDPDVLCLQEMPRHPFSDHRVAAFAASVGMLWPGGQRHRCSTTLVASPRVDLHDSGHALYDVPRPQEPRGYAWCHVSKAGGPVITVVSTHMSLYSRLRGPHAHALLDDPHVEAGLPVVITGDFNEEPGGPAVKVITARLQDVGGPALTYPAQDPSRKLDFVFASPGLRVSQVPIAASADDFAAATDHRPVAVDVDVAAAN